MSSGGSRGELGSSASEDLFADWLARRAQGDRLDFDRFCREHPHAERELRRIHDGWLRLQPVLGVDVSATPSGSAGAPEPAIDGDEIERRLASRRESEVRVGDLVRRLAERDHPFHRYALEGEIGRGGMGVVSLAWDPDLHRALAIKRMRRDTDQSRRDTPASASRTARFLDEAQLTGQLDHPGIVPVHEIGLDEAGDPYFTMRLVHGSDLSEIFEWVREQRDGWTQTRALGAILKACEAVSFAHAKGVIHRDLKPANIRVGRFGEVYVMDWGLARVRGRRARDIRIRERPALDARVDGELATEAGSGLLTMDGDVLGTAAYMSPEQADGEIDSVDAQTDVYSMGAILYHLLAGVPPYASPGSNQRPAAVWVSVRQGPPARIGDLAPHQPAELVAICERAMARTVGDRYRSVEELSEDLRAYLENRVVRAHRTGAIVEFTKWVKRNRGMAASIAAAILLAFIGLGSTSYVEAKGRREQARLNGDLRAANADLSAARDDAQRSAARAIDEKTRADRSATEAKREADEARRQRDSADRVVEFLIGLFKSPDPSESRGEEVSARAVLDRGAKSIDARLEDDPLVRARLLVAMGKSYDALGRYADAEPLYRSALAIQREHSGEAHPDALEAMRLLAEDLASLDRGTEASALAREALSLARTRASSDPRTAIQTLGSLANVLWQASHYAEAEQLTGEALDLCRRTNGPEHVDTLTLMNNLAAIDMQQACFDDAEVSLCEVLEIRRRILGADHPDTLAAMHNLAICCRFLGRTADATSLLRQVVEIDTRVLGPEHPDTIDAVDNLAVDLDDLGLDAEGEALHRRAIELSDKVRGPRHPSTLVAMENYAVALADAHRYREAAEVVRDLIERAQATPRELALIVPLEQRIARALEAEGESHAAGSRATETPRR